MTQKTILDKIRDVQRASRINGVLPEYIIMTPTEYEELIDVLLDKGEIPSFQADTPVILGMKIITNEKTIIRL